MARDAGRVSVSLLHVGGVTNQCSKMQMPYNCIPMYAYMHVHTHMAAAVDGLQGRSCESLAGAPGV